MCTNRDQELNAEVESFMNAKIYEVQDQFHETILTTSDKKEAIMIAKLMESGEVVETDLESGECKIIEQ